MLKRAILIGLLSLQILYSHAVQLSSITQYGITWNFDHAYECGQFVTGDWWVVGPVTIVSTTPLSANGHNGSMLNPVGQDQGYDTWGAGYTYNANLAVVFPLTIGGVNSLVTSLQATSPSDCIAANGAAGRTSRRGLCDGRPPIKAIAVLTIVNAVVPAGTFRPSYIGPNHKEFFSVNDIDYNVLPHLPVIGSTPNTTNLKLYLDRPWLDHFNGWTTQVNYAYDNAQGYGGAISNDISEVAGCLMLNIPNLEELTRLMVQRGIEIYGGLRNGANWTADGGHGSGRKWPVLFAGKLLNNQGMLNIGNTYSSYFFGEDCQTYYLPGTPSPATAWWGIRHCYEPAKDQDGLNTYRMCCTSITWPGQMLSALMLGLKTNWNHNAYFDYVDRWINESGGCGSNSIVGNFGSNTPQFIKDLWCLYRNNLPAVIAHNGGNPNPDNVAPTAPILSASAVAGNSLTLTWTPATDNIGVIAYDIYQDNVFSKTVAGSITTSIMSSLVCNTTYSFTVKARDAVGNSSVFSNIEIQATTGVCDPINIALNKTVTVSSFQNDAFWGIYPGENLVDGDESDNGRWSAEVFPQWAEIDLGADYNLSYVKLYPYQNLAYQYIIEAKPTGGIYSTIVNRSTNTTAADFIQDNVTGTARYVKITVTSGGTGGWTSLSELKVYGNLASVVTGISEKTSVAGITMIPNPTTGIVNLSAATEWTLKSIDGKILQTGTGKVIDLSKYANGVYIIVIGNKQEKIIKL